MCSICLHNPCLPGCPNAPEPEPVHECGECGFGIYEGDKFAEIDGEYYCKKCLDDMAVETLLSLFDIDLETAEYDDGGFYDD